MVAVIIYAFSGRFAGTSDYDYKHPELGATHKSLLFLAQELESNDFDLARAECAKYGFADVAFSGGGPLKVDVLNTDLYRGFAGLYEEALNSGSALVFYPNT